MYPMSDSYSATLKLRLDQTDLDRIDAARGDCSRSAWARLALRQALDSDLAHLAQRSTAPASSPPAMTRPAPIPGPRPKRDSVVPIPKR